MENNIADAGSIDMSQIGARYSICHGLHFEDPPKDAGPDLSIGGPGTKARSDRMRSAICIRARRRAVSVAARDYRTADYSTAIYNASFQVSVASDLFYVYPHRNHDVRKLENRRRVETSNQLIFVTLFFPLLHTDVSLA